MQNKTLPKNLKPLFWEYNISDLDVDKHRDIIISRILEKGRVEHLKILFKLYSSKKVLLNIKSNIHVTSSTKRFWFDMFAL